jgi:hypothetical protein
MACLFLLSLRLMLPGIAVKRAPVCAPGASLQKTRRSFGDCGQPEL